MTTISRRAKHPPWVYARRILTNVWTDPAVRDERVAAVTRTIGWQVYKRLLPRPITRELVPGVRIRCYPDSSIASKVIYLGGFTDHHEGAFLRRYLRPGDTVLDCGANIGTYALLMAHLVGPRGTVIAFEPFPPIRERLEENIALNGFEGRVRVHGEALSDAPGMVQFVADKDTAKRVWSSHEPVEAQRIDIPVTTIDASVDTPLAFAKADVEGSEVHLLEGARRLLESRPPVVWQFEVVDGLLRRQGRSASDLYRLMADHGYVFATYDGDRNELTRCAPEGHHDIFAVLETRWAEVIERLRGSRGSQAR